MNNTHWKKLTNPDYLGAYALEPGKDITVTIKSVTREMVVGEGGKKDECTVAKFTENIKPMILNATNCKTISKIYKTPFIEQWLNRKITIFIDNVLVKGEMIEALRIRPTIPKSTVVVTKCADCNEDIKGYDKFTAEQIAQGSYNKFGKFLCTSCAQKAKESIVEATNPFDTTQTVAEPTEPTTPEPTTPEPTTPEIEKITEEY